MPRKPARAYTGPLASPSHGAAPKARAPCLSSKAPVSPQMIRRGRGAETGPPGLAGVGGRRPGEMLRVDVMCQKASLRGPPADQRRATQSSTPALPHRRQGRPGTDHLITGSWQITLPADGQKVSSPPAPPSLSGPTPGGDDQGVFRNKCEHWKHQVLATKKSKTGFPTISPELGLLRQTLISSQASDRGIVRFSNRRNASSPHPSFPEAATAGEAGGGSPSPRHSSLGTNRQLCSSPDLKYFSFPDKNV